MKFEKVGPEHQPRIEGRIYLVLGAESRDRERLLLVPGSPPIPYNFQKEGEAPRDSRGFPPRPRRQKTKRSGFRNDGWKVVGSVRRLEGSCRTKQTSR